MTSPDPRPTGLRLLGSARTEDLLERLLDDLEAARPEDPLARECVVVQNRGMARWLELQASARLGVWANPWFPFPRSFVNWLHRRACGAPADAGTGALGEEVLCWAIAAALPGLVGRSEFEPLRAWLGPEPDASRQLSLAGELAAVYDHYLLHAPDMLLEWEAAVAGAPSASDRADGVEATDGPVVTGAVGGTGAQGLTIAAAAAATQGSPTVFGDRPDAERLATVAWQAPLWRAALARLPQDRRHAARRASDLCERLRQGPAPDLRGLKHVFVFGVSALSRTYLGVLEALSRHVPVTLYALAPSGSDAALVAEIVRSARWRADERAGPYADELAGRLAALAGVHPLVAGQAGAVRHFQALVVAVGGSSEAVAAAPVAGGARPAAPPTLLGRLQADIEAGGAPSPCADAVAGMIAGTDLSVGLHACHGPLREAEVARDQILAAFQELPGLAPHEVVVMAPEVDAYAPYLEAVLGVGGADGAAIPHRVADRPAVAGRPGADAFLGALEVLRGRLTAPEVVDLLGLAPVRAARRLSAEEVEAVAGWARDAGIRWGLDAEHRAAVGQPALPANTWRWGLARLASGWAAPGDGASCLDSTLPFPAAGTHSHALGAVLELLDLLERYRSELGSARLGMDDWCDRLGAFCGDLLGRRGQYDDDRAFVEAALGRVADRARVAGFDTRLPLDAVIEAVGGVLADDAPPRGFLEGALTVCALVPMRAIPFRVVVLVGMNDGAFPRTDRPPDFDLVARRRRLGDTTRRATDRLLFLEAVLSARDRLIVTWTGRDPSTDADAPPSVVVSELLDVLAEMGRAPGGPGPARKTLFVSHALHPFSPKYFTDCPDERWFSFARDRAAIALRPAAAVRRGRPALSVAPPGVEAPGAPMGRAEGEPTDGPAAPVCVTVEDLATFLERPARRLVRDRLGIVLPEALEPLSDREPMALTALDRHVVGEAIVRGRLKGWSGEQAMAAASAAGHLPLGTPGALDLVPIAAAAEEIVGVAGLVSAGTSPRAVPVALSLADGAVSLSGALDGLLPAGRLEVTYGRVDDKRVLRLWVRHLVLALALSSRGRGLEEGGRPVTVAPVSWLVGRARKGSGTMCARLAEVDDPEALLGPILGLWREAEASVPPYYPLAARAWHDESKRRLEKGESRESAERAAERKAATAFGTGWREPDASGPRWHSTDLDDAELALALGDDLPWDEDGTARDGPNPARFRAAVEAVLGPLDEHLELLGGSDLPARLGATRRGEEETP